MQWNRERMRISLKQNIFTAAITEAITEAKIFTAAITEAIAAVIAAVKTSRIPWE